MAGDDDETTPHTPPDRPKAIRAEARASTAAGVYSMQTPPHGRSRLPSVGSEEALPLPPPPTGPRRRRLPEAAPSPIDREDITGRIDLGVRQAVATLPPPMLTGADLAKIVLGVVSSLLVAGCIALVTRGCRVIEDINDRPTRPEVREDIRRAVDPIDKKLDRLLERRP